MGHSPASRLEQIGTDMLRAREREREREFQYVHSASLTYEDEALFMSQPSESRLSYSHRQPVGPCAKQRIAWHLQSSHTIEQTGL